jgi:chromosome partitioning protein
LKSIAFFNNRLGSGSTTLLYNLAWMYSELGLRTLFVDFDPQAAVTEMLLDERQMGSLYYGQGIKTLYQGMEPGFKKRGKIAPVELVDVNTQLAILPGDPALSSVEDDLSAAWFEPGTDQRRLAEVISGFRSVIQHAVQTHETEILLLDVGPGLGYLNRFALACAESLIVTLSPDINSLQALRSMGLALAQWPRQFGDRETCLEGCRRRSKSAEFGIGLPV